MTKAATRGAARQKRHERIRLRLEGTSARPRLAAGFAGFAIRIWPSGLDHQDLVQRAAAASSCWRASTQLAPVGFSSRFQNGALAFR